MTEVTVSDAGTGTGGAVGELVDSMTIRNDGTLLRERIAEDGYLLFRGLLDEAKVRDTGHDVLGVLQEKGWLEQGAAPDRAAPRAPLPQMYGDEYWDLYLAVHRREAIHRLCWDQGLQLVMRELVGADVFVLPRKIVRLIGPVGYGGPAIGASPHRDYGGFRIPDMFVTWIPFVDCPRERGGLYVLPGSQKDGVAPPPKFDPDDGAWATTGYVPGDVVVFHCFTAHATIPNRSDQFRISVDYRWQRASLPVPAAMLESDVNLDWSELTGGWASLRWVEVPSGLTLYDQGDDWDEVTETPPSNFVTVQGTTGREPDGLPGKVLGRISGLMTRRRAHQGRNRQ